MKNTLQDMFGEAFAPDGSSIRSNFERWFGASKIVDANGAPLILYHGTDKEFDRFKRRPGDIGMHFGTLEQANDRMEYMGEHGHQNSTTQRLIPVYLSIRNPLRLDDSGLWNVENLMWVLDKAFPGDRVLGQHKSRWDRGTPTSCKQLREYLQGKGYDGIVYANTGEVGGSEPYRKAIRLAKDALKRAYPDVKNSFSVEMQATLEYKAYSAAEKAYTDFREASAQDSYIAFEPSQIKSAVGNVGLFDPSCPDITDKTSKKNRSPTAQRAQQALKMIDALQNSPSPALTR